LVDLRIREYNQVKHWFSNQRQREAKPNLENKSVSPSPSSTSSRGGTIESTLTKVPCDGRAMRLRPSAVAVKDIDWTDELFGELVMIHNFKILVEMSRGFSRY